MKSLPVGQQSFVDLLANNNYYVDKTPFIKAVMTTAAQVLLITRPRRFGKTLFMDTLQQFLEIDSANPGCSDANAKLFNGLKILEDKAFCDAWMGQHPVISLSLKGAEADTFELAYELFALNLVAVAKKYAFLMDSPKVTEDDKAMLANYMSSDYMGNPANKARVILFLKNLANMVSAHYGRKVIILIDEYDVPLAKAAAHGYYAKMVTVIRGFMYEALKPYPATEAFLLKGVLTGCLRVSKESIFTGLNNPDVNTICSEDYTLSEAIGFTESEVKSLLDYYHLAPCFERIKAWYDGYRFHRSDIYCPWDVINFCSEAIRFEDPVQYAPRNYWANSSGNDIINEFLGFLSGADTDKMQTLVDGGTIDIRVNEKLNYGELAQHNSCDFWTVLFYTGYLTIAERLPSHPLDFRVRLPNEEIRETFKANVASHFSKFNQQYANRGMDFVKAALAGDADRMADELDTLLKNYVSVRDTATKAPAENYYHGLLTSLVACAESLLATFQSNGEAGDGYADLAFTAGSGSRRTGVVIEIKRCDKPEDLYDAAQVALAQIHSKHYTDYLDKMRCTTQHVYGIAFCGRLCSVLGESQSDR